MTDPELARETAEKIFPMCSIRKRVDDATALILAAFARRDAAHSLPAVEAAARAVDERWKDCLKHSGCNAIPTDIAAIITKHLAPGLQGGVDKPHWAVGKALRRAFISTLQPYGLDLINKTFGAGNTSAEHLRWMVRELLQNIDTFPTDKTSRWIGFIQGVMAANGLLDVDAERERTRPFFQKAYAMAEALSPPPQNEAGTAPHTHKEWKAFDEQERLLDDTATLCRRLCKALRKEHPL